MAAKRAASKKASKPSHPLMLNRQAWDRAKVVEHVCSVLVSSTHSIAKILAAGYHGHTLPSYTAFKEWVQQDEILAARYAHAKEDQADYLADDLLDVADEPPETDGETGRIDPAWVQRQRMRIDARKWAASKLKPKKYGDRLSLDGKVDGRTTLVLRDLTGRQEDADV